MLISEIMNKLFKWSPITERENKSDVLVYGDINKDVSNIAVCLILTPEVLRKAKASGAEFIITHEPTLPLFIEDNLSKDTLNSDKVYLAKKKLLEEIDIPVYRFHDHSHFTETDKIHTGFVKKLGIKGSFDGKRLFTLDTPMSIDELEAELSKKLDLKHIRFVGKRDKSVKAFSLCAGSWGAKTIYTELNRLGVDLVICGEITEWNICEYVRDSAELGIDKALFVLGHMSSERCGMEYICDYINENIDGVTATYIECGEAFN